MMYVSILTLNHKLPFGAWVNVNLLADVVKDKKKINKNTIDSSNIKPSVAKPNRVLYSFDKPERVTEFYTDTNHINLPNFIAKLKELKLGKKQKVRIAYIGDSMIEGDLISMTVRKQLQQQFGGYGVGYVPITSAVAGMRSTVYHQFAPNWVNDDFRNHSHKQPLFLSGHTFFANGSAWFSANDRTTSTPNLPIEKYIFTGNNASNANVFCNGKNIAINANNMFEKTLIDTSHLYNIKLQVSDATLPVYGVSFESASGVIVDNYSFRGSSGIEFGKMDTTFLNVINSQHPYDLVIFQYGVNLLNTPNADDFNWYLLPMKKSVEKIKKAFKNADIILVSTADKAFRYPTGITTAIGIYDLITLQQQIAFETGVGFYNLYATMGGDSSIIKWVNAKPALAYKDYTHTTPLGSEVLAKGLIQAILHEYNAYSSLKK